MGPTAIAFAGMAILPVILELIDRLQGDPEADVSRALKALQKEQESDILTKVSLEQRREQETTAKYQLPMNQMLRDIVARQTGVIGGPSAGVNYPLDTGMPGEASPLVSDISTKLGVTPQDLSSRLNPTRLGSMIRGNRTLSQMALRQSQE